MKKIRKILLFLLLLLSSIPMSGRGIYHNGDAIKTFTVNNNGRSVSFKMIRVEAGTFKMGSTTGDCDEQPVHSVTLTNDYYIGETEVTQELWEAVMGSNPSYFVGAQNPVERVSWNDCKTFINKLYSLTGQNFRLPTEAEWEYAARGGNKSRNYTCSGSNNLDDVAWYINNSSNKTHPVRTKAPNELGIYDMSGNVYEWCEDWYYPHYQNAPSTNPTGPASGSYRVIRGGYWGRIILRCGPAERSCGSPSKTYRSVGLRLALQKGVQQAKNNNAQQFHQNNAARTDTKTFTVSNYGRSVSFNMIRVKAGTFQMGSTIGENNEQPLHNVTLTNDYYIGETEVTQELWKAVMGSNPSYFVGGQNPVERVSWNDCKVFINKLNSLTGQKFRLPSEAEWEYAARGGNISCNYTYSGSNNLDDVAWYEDNSSSKTHPVKTKAPNELGIYDMSGNVLEWCEDWYDESYYKNSPTTNPTGPASGSHRVIRGGSWYYNASYCRSADRYIYLSSYPIYFLGLRLALQKGVQQTKNNNVQQAHQNNAARTDTKTFTVNNYGRSVSFNMIRVEAGTFKMGSTTGYSSETPVHSVTLTNDYYIGQTEVTQELWEAVMDSNPSWFKVAQNPVERVSWNDCKTFINKLNSLTGQNFRLPTEAEWEYAARGGNKSRNYTYSGSNDANDVAWYHDNSSSKTHPVKKKAPNELGIYDMSGNVSEWCEDWYDESYYKNSPTTNPTGPASGSSRVDRGGSWDYDAAFCRSADRDYSAPSASNILLGLRLAL